MQALALILVLSAPPQSPAPFDSIARLIDLDGLPVREGGVRCLQFASTDPTGKGNDHGHYLRSDGDRHVLAEMNGPGVVTRIWSANAAGRIRVFLDGEREPRIDAPFQALFTGAYPPFAEPIATHRSGGWISYFPIPYRKSCRIEVDRLEDPGALYYHVQYLRLPPESRVRTFTRDLPERERQALEEVLRRWRNPGPRGDAARADGREIRASIRLGPAESREAFALDGEGTILELRARVDPPVPEVLRGVLLSASFEGTRTVAVPLGDLFGCGFGPVAHAGLAVGWDEDGGYCAFPMPFRRGASIALRNASERPARIECSIRVARRRPPEGAMTFHAEFRSVDGVGADLYEIADAEGPGKLVMVSQALQGVGNLWYLEGNEQFFVDGEERPSILGTGTEDFYNGGWYWSEGPFALPLHGLSEKAEWTTNRTTPWRTFVPDAVPFERRMRACIEHGSSNEVKDAYYSSVACFYAKAQPVRDVPDSELRVPRLWVCRARGFTGASDLAWEPEVPLVKWEERTEHWRGLAKPVFQQFPVSYTEHGKDFVDSRAAMLAPGRESCTARFSVPIDDRYRLRLRWFCEGEPPRLSVDGRSKVLAPEPLDRGPLPSFRADAGPLAAGEHSLGFECGERTRLLLFDSLRAESASPFVRTFWIAPPIEARKDGTVEDEMPEEATFLAPDFDPQAAGWKLVKAAGDSLDLNREVSSQSPMLAYLLVFVRAPAARRATFLLGSDDGVRVWVDGTLVHSHEIHRHLQADEDRCDADLRPGWNRVLLKVKNDYGGYGVCLRICDIDGELRVGERAR
ncbi:MAG: hypothetical protein Fur0037_23040 [Planctomycetota bacterium]